MLKPLTAVRRLVRLGAVFTLLLCAAPAQTRIPAEGFESLDATIESLVAAYQIPGASVAFARSGRLRTVRAYGWADTGAAEPFLPESASRWNSISKTVTSVALLQLVEQGRLDLDARVFDILDHIRPYNGVWGDQRIPQITVRQLLHHTGGWNRDTSGDPLMPPRRDQAYAALGGPFPPSAETMARYTISQPLDFAPGSRYVYSNFGFLLLGLVLEKVSGQPAETATRAGVLDPISLTGMKRALNRLDQRQPGEVRYYDVPGASPIVSAFLPGGQRTPAPYAFLDFENILPVGGWLGSVVHLARFAESIDGQRPPAALTPAMVSRMMEAPDPGLWMSSTTFYGLGISVQSIAGLTVWTHSGSSSGSRSAFARFSNGCTFAMLFNGEEPGGASRFYSAMINALYTECLGNRAWPEEDLFPRYLAPRAASVVSSAAFRPGPVAPDSLLTLFGAELDGSDLRVRDSAGVEREISQLCSSLAQVNFHLPAGVALGPASLLLRRPPHAEVAVPLEIAPVAPAIFTANPDGLAAGIVTRVRGGVQTTASTLDPTRPPDASEDLYLSLYGTGLRGGAVSVAIDGTPVPVDFSGAQPTVSGLDQVNVKLPRALIHSGTLTFVVTAGGVAANPVSIGFQ